MSMTIYVNFALIISLETWWISSRSLKRKFIQEVTFEQRIQLLRLLYLSFLPLQLHNSYVTSWIFWSTQIDDLETIKLAREEDLRTAGLRMGDIIKIRRTVANQSTGEMNISLSSVSEQDSDDTITKNWSSTPNKQVSLIIYKVFLRCFPA